MFKTLIGMAEQNRMLRSLTELVEALDRRMPRPHVSGERQIASDAAQLHAEATERIGEMRLELRRREDVETAMAHSVMTDDGGPAPS